MINTKNLSVKRQQNQILTDVNLQLKEKERLFLQGPIGCGKSTLLHTLLGFLPFSGEIYLFGQKCETEKQFATFRGKIGLLFQQPDDQLFGPTVLDDVAFGVLNQGFSRQAAYDLALQQLQQLDIKHLAHRSVNQLSGGEKNFTALAGILVMQPKVLLLDEPTNGLDRHNVTRLCQLLLSLDCAMIVASHDVDFTQQIATDVMTFNPEPQFP